MQKTSACFSLPSLESTTSILSIFKKETSPLLINNSHLMSLKAGNSKNTSISSREIDCSAKLQGSRSKKSKEKSWRLTPSIPASTNAARKWQRSIENKCWSKSTNYLKITLNWIIAFLQMESSLIQIYSSSTISPERSNSNNARKKTTRRS